MFGVSGMNSLFLGLAKNRALFHNCTASVVGRNACTREFSDVSNNKHGCELLRKRVLNGAHKILRGRGDSAP